ncbi:MAG: hypothetical protein US40_C0013G0010 [Candidatus Roizmanbacteria bacterium GW2011_GWC2_37_13]|uniref:Uncharacterized protein n=1 Tax=Candidatus Roizmanbacteria bacterium GW2011_GWC2_37_13 TaxID=1618486 RepID=A0A0G0G103_9BACT|nr:MAG: hypothetical protein US38_C0014G0012 [Candidatus Roizmanbacteria bacterium GW2011_GWC1_37_12]KKQ24878.1 MAG: hypothetical protein US40_C0013G0010 [Candidatus Roizmanbacteria bacterium GW2011_GWC2_37_13]
MKKYFSFFLTLFFYLFFLPVLIGAQRVDDISSIMSQGANRTCLKRTSGGNQAHPATGKMVMNATLNLTGSCLSQTGCEIWLHNSGNDNIDVNEQMLAKCNNGGTQNYCNDTQKIEDEIAREVNVRPGWTRITNFTILSARPGRTEIALNNDERVLGEETTRTESEAMVPPGEVDISVQDRYAGHVAYSYYAIGDANTSFEGEGLGTGGEDVDQNNTQQLGLIPQPTVNPFTEEGRKEDCVTLYWDPFGRVFDAKSLEPIAGVDVTLLDSFGNPAVVDGPFKNWDTTKIDNGVYNILVSKEADYQLKVDAPESHLFTREVNLDPNYSLVYSDIYLPGDIFHEAPMPEVITEDFDYSSYHHDIPLVPKGEPYRVDPSEVFVIKSSLHQVDMNGFVNYSGKATFPKAKICLVGEDRRQVVGNCVNAEKYGSFRINVEKNKLPQERLLLSAEKVDLTKPIIKNNNVDLSKIDFESKDSLGFEPILNYIEGYAYDENGQRIPNPKITVKLREGDLTFYTTQADDSGFFTIYGKNLPFPEYYLEFTDEFGKAYQKTTSAFVKDNGSYIKSEGLDLINSTKSDQPIINPATGQLNQIIKKIEAPKESNKITPNFNFILTGLILVVLLFVFAGVLLYFYQKKNSTAVHGLDN